jgi:hypothetical protein
VPRVSFEKAFYFGSKQLALYRHSTEKSIKFGGELTKSGEPKSEGDTTAIYHMLADYLQSLANQTQQKINYTFSTRHPKMVKWAEHKAPWHWEELEDLKPRRKNGREGKKGKVTFRPEKQL